MSVNILMDKAHEPDDELIESSLGKTWPFFGETRALTAACAQDWKHYGKKYGWKLKVHAEGKSLAELTVADGWFLVAMAIREEERQALRAAPAAAALGDIAAANDKLPEGYGIRIEVRDRASCERAMTLLRFIMTKRALAC